MVTHPRILLLAAEAGPALADNLAGLGADVHLAMAADWAADDAGLYGPGLERVAEAAYARLGGIDAVVFCDPTRQTAAGPADPDAIIDAAADATRRLLAVVRCLAPRIIKDGAGGQFILVCDVAGFAGRVGLLPTSTVGGALIGMGKSVAKELGRHRLSVNIICHGLIDGMDSAVAYTPAEAMMLKATGMGKPGSVAHLAHNIAYLAQGGHWINGQVLHVSDGLIT
ncbi:MAG: SDR family oxidoreductase [Candidatus Methylumidiphilus sp.]